MSNEIDYLRASDGTGEAVRAVVTATRSTSATTLQVDAVTRWPSKFVATAGEYNPETGLIDPATALVFKGSLDGTNLLIDEIAPGYADNGNSVGDVVVIKPASFWADILADFAERTNTGGVLVNTEYFTSSGTWTKPANLKFVVVEVQGGGGGGGGSGNTNGRRGAGGSAGGYGRKKIDAASLGSTETVTIGSGGSGGSNTGNGGNGGNTSFGSHVTANGGGGGAVGSSNDVIQPTSGGTVTGADFEMVGQHGGPGGTISTEVVATRLGNGGDSFYGFGGQPTAGSNTNGRAGQNYGAGGSGGSRAGTSSSTGGAGRAGLVIVHEYF